MHTKINWFEIPSSDFSRAVKFYESIFDTKLRIEDFGNCPMALFADGSGEAVGCVVHHEQYVPGQHGAVIYLDATPAIDTVLARIEAAGGRIVMEKMQLPKDIGYIAHFTDTEGNRLALHAMA